MPFGHSRRRPAKHGPLLVVDRGVEAQLLGEPPALVVAAGDAHDPHPLDLPDLPHERPHGARRGGHDERLPFLRLADLQEPDPRGEADVAEQAEVSGERQRDGWQLRQRRSREDRVALPSEHSLHDVARREARRARLLDPAEGDPPHHAVERHRRQVGVARGPAAVRGVEREVDRPDEGLAVLERRRLLLHPAEVRLLEEPLGTGHETPLRVPGHARDLLARFYGRMPGS